jgi:hypothetical protein
MKLREELYAEDNSSQSPNPYSVLEYNYKVSLLQPIQNGFRHASFYNYQEEKITCHYERNPADPRIEQDFTLDVDNYGNVKKKTTLYYPRRGQYSPNPQSGWTSENFPEQFQLRAILTVTDYAQIIDHDDIWITGELYQSKSYELNLPGISESGLLNAYQFSDVATSVGTALSNPVDYGANFSGSIKQGRLYNWKRNYFWDGLLGGCLHLGTISPQVLLCYSQSAVAPTQYISDNFGSAVTNELMQDEGGYIQDIELGTGNPYWLNQGLTHYYYPGNQFFLPQKSEIIMYGIPNDTVYTYDTPYDLNIIKSVDPVGNTVQAQINYRTLKPWNLIDFNGNNSQVFYDELGKVIVSTIFGNIDTVPSGDGNVASYNLISNPSRDDIIAHPENYLQGTTAFFYYDHFAWLNDVMMH